jgi:hypothetical protein
MRNQTLSSTLVAQQFQENTSTATSVLLLQSCISCIITHLNWKQAAKPLHIEQHRHGQAEVSSSPMGKKECKRNCVKQMTDIFPRFHWQMLNED